MIDYSDGDAFLDASLFSSGIVAILFIIIAIVIYIEAHSNEVSCEKKICPNGEKSLLLNHKCCCLQYLE